MLSSNKCVVFTFTDPQSVTVKETATRGQEREESKGMRSVLVGAITEPNTVLGKIPL